MNPQSAMIERYLTIHEKEFVEALINSYQYTRLGKTRIKDIMAEYNKDKDEKLKTTGSALGMTLRHLGFAKAMLYNRITKNCDRAIYWNDELVNELRKKHGI